MMPRHIVPKPLLMTVLARLKEILTKWILTTSHNCSGEKMVEIVDIIRKLVYSHVARTLYQDINLLIIKAVEEAAELQSFLVRRGEGDISNISRRSQEMSNVLRFVDLLVSPDLHVLDVMVMSKMVRSVMYDKLPYCRGLKSLVLGSGSGGWSDIYIEKFKLGVCNMRHLVRFSLCYDCNDDILSLLSSNCRSSLRIVDVEMSKQVTDISVGHLVKCRNIDTLHIFHTGISSKGQANLLISLQHLKVLVRGGFLCEALEQIEQDHDQLPVLNLTEFWSSEEYYFHDDRQMRLVYKCCPIITKMMFQFSTEVMIDLTFISKFQFLCELHLWGGHFYIDKINKILVEIGHQLDTLYLIHSEAVDRESLLLICQNCYNLTTLGLYNVEFELRQTEEEEEAFFHPTVGRKQVVQPLLDLKMLAMVSDCPSEYLVLLLSVCLNLEHFKAGINCRLTHHDIETILQKNKLAKLQVFNIPVSSELSMDTVELLLDSCPQINNIQDLNYWKKISAWQYETFRKSLVEQNLDIDVGVSTVEEQSKEHIEDLSENVINYLMGN